MFLLQEGIMKAWNFLLSLLENSINFIAHYNRLFFIKTITTKSSIPHALLQCDPDIPPWREGVWFPSLWIWVVVNDSFLTKKNPLSVTLHVFMSSEGKSDKWPSSHLGYLNIHSRDSSSHSCHALRGQRHKRNQEEFRSAVIPMPIPWVIPSQMPEMWVQ